jgi:hypothetical protein
MKQINLNDLENKGSEFVKKVITNSNQLNSSDFLKRIIDLIKKDIIEIDIQEFQYYLPKQIRFIDSNKIISDKETFGLSVFGSVVLNENMSIPLLDSEDNFISFEDKKFNFILHLEVSYNQLGKNEIDVINIYTFGYYYESEKESYKEWETIQQMITDAKKIDEISPNSKLLEKIDTIEVAEDLMRSIGEDIDEDLFLEKVILLQKVADIKDFKTVFYEYGSVSKITNQPVLMNKAFSIFLTKEQVVGLIADLSDRYRKIIENIRAENIYNLFKANNYIVPIVFGKTERGHADSTNFEIVLPKLGDWRTGYRDLYTAELVFHEFSHILDSGRRMTQRNKATFDVHRHDFVELFDMVLVDYKEWINKNYNPQLMRDMILYLKNWITEFKVGYDSRINAIKKQEKTRMLSIQEDEDEIKQNLGISKNSFPIDILLENDKEEKLKFMLFALERDMNKSMADNFKRSLLNARIKILDFQDDIEPKIILDKQELDTLLKSLENTEINSYIRDRSLDDGIKIMNLTKDFKNKLQMLSDNKLPFEKKKETIVIEDYPMDDIQDFLSTLKR